MFVRCFTFADIINSTGGSPIMGFVGKLEEIRARARQHIEDGAVINSACLRAAGLLA
jgi:hypothetical protein